ncbi:hypothetical protein C0J08_03570 [Marinomonas sp. CT5]|nr:hypothetical protein C0J08_03570 [Marinomonas sp. CT5]
MVKSREKLSVQMHCHRTWYWVVVFGVEKMVSIIIRFYRKCFKFYI